MPTLARHRASGNGAVPGMGRGRTVAARLNCFGLGLLASIYGEIGGLSYCREKLTVPLFSVPYPVAWCPLSCFPLACNCQGALLLSRPQV